MKPGTRLWSAVSAASVVVVRPPSEEVKLTCGGVPMLDHEPQVTSVDGATGEGPAIGKRYVDAGVLAVDGRPLTMMNSRALPASD